MDWLSQLLNPQAPQQPAGNSPSPQLQDQMNGLASLEDRNRAIDEQMAQAEAMRNSRTAQGHKTGMGSALAGLGDAIKNTWGSYNQAQLEKQRQANFDKVDAANNAYREDMKSIMAKHQKQQDEMFDLWKQEQQAKVLRLGGGQQGGPGAPQAPGAPSVQAPQGPPPMYGGMAPGMDPQQLGMDPQQLGMDPQQQINPYGMQGYPSSLFPQQDPYGLSNPFDGTANPYLTGGEQ